MTEKRFVVEKYSIRDMSIDEKYVNSTYHIGDKGIAQSLCDLLNKINYENNELKDFINQLQEELVLFKNAGADMGADLNAQIISLKKEKEDKQSHITHLENKIHRMRDNIKRLEGLYHYRGWEGTGDVKKECYQFKKEYTQLKKENQKLKNELKIADDNIGILQSENERLKSTLRDCCEKRRINDDEAIEWLRNNMVWEQMPSGKRTKSVIKTENHYVIKKRE